MTLQVLRGRARTDAREDLELAKELPIESFKLLLRAAWYAQNARQPAWEFALNLATLRAAGLTDCDLRWLALKQYVDYAPEKPPAAPPTMPIGRVGGPRGFTQRSLFVLTPHGRRFVERLLQRSAATCLPHASGPALAGRISDSSVAPVPCWDGERRELSLGRTLIKRFSVPAENQELILSSFQEEAWPPHLDDPLPPAPGIDTKRRLHATIQCLNRNQKAPLLRFHGDGYGRGICWKQLLPEAG